MKSSLDQGDIERALAGLDLATVWRAISSSPALEDWRREQMLNDVLSLAEFCGSAPSSDVRAALTAPRS